MLLYTTVVIAPLLSSFFYSLTDWNGFNAQFNFIGLKNFQKITQDPIFANAIRNSGNLDAGRGPRAVGLRSGDCPGPA